MSLGYMDFMSPMMYGGIPYNGMAYSGIPLDQMALPGFDIGGNSWQSFDTFTNSGLYRLNINPQEIKGFTLQTQPSFSGQSTVTPIPIDTILNDNSKYSEIGAGEIIAGTGLALAGIVGLKKGGTAAWKKLSGAFSKFSGKGASELVNSGRLALPSSKPAQLLNVPTNQQLANSTYRAADGITILSNTKGKAAQQVATATQKAAERIASTSTAAGAAGQMNIKTAQHIWGRLSKKDRSKYINAICKSIQNTIVAEQQAMGKPLCGEEKHRIFRLVNNYLTKAAQKGHAAFEPDIAKKAQEIGRNAIIV